MVPNWWSKWFDFTRFFKLLQSCLKFKNYLISIGNSVKHKPSLLLLLTSYLAQLHHHSPSEERQHEAGICVRVCAHKGMDISVWGRRRLMKSSKVLDGCFLILSLYHLVMLPVLQVGCQLSILSLLSPVLGGITLKEKHRVTGTDTIALFLHKLSGLVWFPELWLKLWVCGWETGRIRSMPHELL